MGLPEALPEGAAPEPHARDVFLMEALCQFSPRPVGPMHRLDAAALRGALQGAVPACVGVLRDAFTPHAAPPRPLHELLAGALPKAEAAAALQRQEQQAGTAAAALPDAHAWPRVQLLPTALHAAVAAEAVGAAGDVAVRPAPPTARCGEPGADAAAGAAPPAAAARLDWSGCAQRGDRGAAPPHGQHGAGEQAEAGGDWWLGSERCSGGEGVIDGGAAHACLPGCGGCSGSGRGGALVDVYVAQPSGGGHALAAQGLPLCWLLSGPRPMAGPPAPRPPARTGPRQATGRVLMVAPTAFEFNAEAAADNTFMHGGDGTKGAGIARAALAEFAALHGALTRLAGVGVDLFEHAPVHGTPDACFPNNVFSVHPAGEGGCTEPTLVLYPMRCPSRRRERRPDMLGHVRGALGASPRVVDLTAWEARGEFLEGTGSLVLDRAGGVAYACLSERASGAVLAQWGAALGYARVVAFRAVDRGGRPIYHTNVMMALGAGWAVVCGDSIVDPSERCAVLAMLSAEREVIHISMEQVEAFAGNILELHTPTCGRLVAMSSTAYAAFTPAQRCVLRRAGGPGRLLHVPFDTIERVGGGGVRCTLAELFC